MSIRNLDYLFKPTSIALIGASRKPRSIGQVVARNLFHCGFAGPIMPVNPREQAIEGVLTYNSVADLPLTPDLAVICTPPQTVPGLIHELGARGTRAAVVITAGFGELGAEGKLLEQELLDAARPHLLRILGPNCVGLGVPGLGINASFIHVHAAKGDIALVAQSGAVITSTVDWAVARNIGFSHLVSLGDQADVDFGDMLDYLALDPNVRAILVYAEAITNPRKFMSAARVAARQKPVIVIKAGRSDEAAKAAASHTGALAGSDAVIDAALRRAGVLRVESLEDLFEAAETVSTPLSATAVQRMVGGRLAILTNGGGLGVLATDTLVHRGGRLAEITPKTVEALNKVLPPVWSHGNPVDIIGDASAKRYQDSLTLLLEEPEIDGLLILNCPTAVGDSYWAAQGVVETLATNPAAKHLPVLTSWIGEGTTTESRRLFSSHRIPTFRTPGEAVKAFMHLVNFYRNQEMLMQTPESLPKRFVTDEAAARAVIEAALAEGRPWLSEYEAKQVLAAYQVPVVETRRVATPEEAYAAAGEMDGPLALKILSPDFLHKSDVGGVTLNLTTPERVRDEATAMLERVLAIKADARIEGFTVQQMAVRPHAEELIVGVVEDALFGPVILFGQGGVRVEVLADKALALPPLNMALARELMSGTRVWKLLQGYRDRPRAAIDDIALTLIKISQLVVDFPEIVELDINPLFADAHGVLALDARIKVRAPVRPGASRLAIHPYPKELEQRVTIPDGHQFLLRPIRPEDEPGLQRLVEHMTPEDIRMRFFSPIKKLSHRMASRLTQIDYDREMSLVAIPLDGDPSDELMGSVHYSADPDLNSAEYAIMVQSDLKGHGLGYLLMTEIIAYARSHGVGELFGEVLRENHPMLDMCEVLGFRRESKPDEPELVSVRLKL